jgi:UDP-3-O-[3-hydroxymyristoyl] N-acetylglucosamine deacetylase
MVTKRGGRAACLRVKLSKSQQNHDDRFVTIKSYMVKKRDFPDPMQTAIVSQIRHRLTGIMGRAACRKSLEYSMVFDWRGQQSTIARSAFVSGIGVHSGESTTLALHPAEPDSGIVFRRIRPGFEAVVIPAISTSVCNTDYCTAVGFGTVSIATIEHLMAALYACGIDNLTIDVDSNEVPILDGSSAPFIALIEDAGIEMQDAPRRYIRVKKPVRVETGASWAEFLPHEGTRFEVEIDFESPIIGCQKYVGEINAASFRRDLSRARTFGFLRNVERLWASGHALGSSLDNSVVIGHDDAVINAEGLRYKDEFVRHKALDAVGDLALAGAQFIGCFRSYRGGHAMNAKALRTLLSDRSAFEIVEPRKIKSVARGGDLVAVAAPVYAPWVL